jgi:mannose/fructose/N-acetylgalactosamine-specific phosphotransferase system component IIB
MIHKLFFENISGLLRIFTNKNVNFKLTIISIQDEKDKIKNNKITYNFITTVLNFPNNIKQILTEFSFLKKNLDYTFFIDKSLKFTLQILDGQDMVTESIIIQYNDIVNLESVNNEKYNSNKKKIIDNNDDDINELLEFYIKNKNEDKDDFIFELE